MNIDNAVFWIAYPFLRFYNLLQRLYQWLWRVFEEDKTGSKQNSIAVLDGVRAIAILLVIFYHIGHTTIDTWAFNNSNPIALSVLSSGSSGVTLFFVLSGLLLFMPYAKSLLTDKRWPLARVFYLRRALRILPGYYLSLIALIVIANHQYLHLANIKRTLLFFTLFMDSSTHTWRQINGPYWTLAIEWQFYMIMPLLVLAFAWIVKRFPLRLRLPVTTLCLLSTIVLALVMRTWGLYYVKHPTETFLVPRNILNVILFFSYGISGKYTEDFAVGMLVGLVYIYAQQAGPASNFTRRARRLSLWFWGFGILILVFASVWHYHNDYHGWPFLTDSSYLYSRFSEIVFSLGYGSCVFAILFGPTELKRPFEWAWLRWIGLISYSLYIWHLPIMTLFETRVIPLFVQKGTLDFYALTGISVLLVTFPFCLCVYIWIEKPWIKRSDRWRRQIEKAYQARLQPPIRRKDEQEKQEKMAVDTAAS